MCFDECCDFISRLDCGKDMATNFTDFVYWKISQDTFDRFVEKTDDGVEIIAYNNHPIKVIPIWKDIDIKDISLDHEIAQATELIQNSDFKIVYFVYPKNDNFTKHIEVKIPELDMKSSDYRVKLIPYTLNNKIKKRIS